MPFEGKYIRKYLPMNMVMDQYKFEINIIINNPKLQAPSMYTNTKLTV